MAMNTGLEMEDAQWKKEGEENSPATNEETEELLLGATGVEDTGTTAKADTIPLEVGV